MTREHPLRPAARELRRAGLSLRAIAERLGSNRMTVSGLVWDIGPRRRYTVPRRNCLLCGVASGASHLCCACRIPRWRENGVQKAQSLVHKEIREGRMRPAREFHCTDCGVPATCYDHRDYSKPLEIEPVCSRCNSRRGPGKWVKHEAVRTMLARIRAANDPPAGAQEQAA